MRIAVVQVAYGDTESAPVRIERVCRLVASVAAGHDLVLLPELWAPTGFDYRRWAAAAEPLQGPFFARMAALATEIGTTLHAGSFVERLPEPGKDGNELANTSLLLGGDGSLLAAYRKIHRFGFGTGEPRLMEAGSEVVVTDLPDGAGGHVRTGISTCYDLRFPELYREQGARGAELFLVPAAWPLARVGHWELLGRARAVENQCVVVQCNTAGTHAGQTMGGRSQVVSARGEQLAVADDTGEHVLSVEIDLAETARYRAEFPVLADRRL